MEQVKIGEYFNVILESGIYKCCITECTGMRSLDTSFEMFIKKVVNKKFLGIFYKTIEWQHDKYIHTREIGDFSNDFKRIGDYFFLDVKIAKRYCEELITDRNFKREMKVKEDETLRNIQHTVNI